MSSDGSGTQTPRKRWYRHIPWWGWVAVAVVVVIAAATGGGGGNKPTADTTATPPVASEPPSPSAEQSPETTTQPADGVPTSEVPLLTVEQVEAFLKESYGLAGGTGPGRTWFNSGKEER
jgi:hypothetical protein